MVCTFCGQRVGQARDANRVSVLPLHAENNLPGPKSCEPTHSDRFLTILEKRYPNWREARAELNDLPLAAEYAEIIPRQMLADEN